MLISAEDLFPYFKTRVDAWVSFFGLTGYNLQVALEDIKEDDCAYCTCNQMTRVARIALNKNWNDGGDWMPLNKQNIDSTAFHEVFHLLHSRFNWLSTCRYVTPEEIQEEEERLAILMENTVFKKLHELV